MVSVEEGRRFEEEKLVASREAASVWKEVMMKGNGFFEDHCGKAIPSAHTPT